MVRKLLPAGLIVAWVAWVAAPAYAQSPPESSRLQVPLNQQVPLTEEEIEKRKETDRAYNAAMQKIPDKKPSADPWGNIRSSAPSAAAKNKQQ